MFMPTSGKIGFTISGTEKLRLETDQFSPILDNAISLGSSTYKYKDAYFSGTMTAAVSSIATLTVTSAITVPNDSFTYAKIQNVSATDKVLGRSTSGAGDIEEITCTAAGRALIDDADAAAQRTTLGLGALAVLNTVTTAVLQVGAVVQSVDSTPYTSNADIATAIPFDDTIPQQSTEGVKICEAAITPTHADNEIEITATVNAAGAGTTVMTLAVFEGETEDAIYAIPFNAASATVPGACTFTFRVPAATTDARTYKLHLGPSTGTIRANGSTAARRYGGKAACTMTVREIKA
jgi:hypothetical protein